MKTNLLLLLSSRPRSLTIIFSAQSGQKPITPTQGYEMAKKLKAAKYLECSARTRVGISTLLDEAVKTALATPPRPRLKCKTFFKEHLLDVYAMFLFSKSFCSSWLFPLSSSILLLAIIGCLAWLLARPLLATSLRAFSTTCLYLDCLSDLYGHRNLPERHM